MNSKQTKTRTRSGSRSGKRSKKTSPPFHRRSHSIKRSMSNVDKRLLHSNSASSTTNKRKHSNIKLTKALTSRKLKAKPSNRYTSQQLKWMLSNMPKDVKSVIRNELTKKVEDDLETLLKAKNLDDIIDYGTHFMVKQYEKNISKLEKLANFFRNNRIEYNQDKFQELEDGLSELIDNQNYYIERLYKTGIMYDIIKERPDDLALFYKEKKQIDNRIANLCKVYISLLRL